MTARLSEAEVDRIKWFWIYEIQNSEVYRIAVWPDANL
jgi:hypothetical protein